MKKVIDRPCKAINLVFFVSAFVPFVLKILTQGSQRFLRRTQGQLVGGLRQWFNVKSKGNYSEGDRQSQGR